MKPLDHFRSNRSILCIIAETTGSCPGRTGFKMAVPVSGPSLGSVGGGSMEYAVISRARRMLQEGAERGELLLFSHTHTASEETRSGMVCSGEQKVLLIPWPPAALSSGEPKGILVSPSGLEFLDRPPEREGFTQGDPWEYAEALEEPLTVYIFGGGHCSKALTPVLKSLGMRTVIVDDRPSVETMESNRLADEKVHADYRLAGEQVPNDGTALVVIMTASHAADAVVLEQMLKKDLRYLGMMASRSTAEHVFSVMREKGRTDEELSCVHSPVGIPIGSHTPAEIAVSIAAEMIKVLNSRR